MKHRQFKHHVHCLMENCKIIMVIFLKLLLKKILEKIVWFCEVWCLSTFLRISDYLAYLNLNIGDRNFDGGARYLKKTEFQVSFPRFASKFWILMTSWGSHIIHHQKQATKNQVPKKSTNHSTLTANSQ